MSDGYLALLLAIISPVELTAEQALRAIRKTYKEER